MWAWDCIHLPPGKGLGQQGNQAHVTIEVACTACRKTFEATLHAGLVRCKPCEESAAIRLQGSRWGRTVVL